MQPVLFEYFCLKISRIDVEPLLVRHDTIGQAHDVVRVVDALEVALAGHGDALDLDRKSTRLNSSHT